MNDTPVSQSELEAHLMLTQLEPALMPSKEWDARMCKTLTAALAEIERLKTPAKWIRCRDRMPTSQDADCYNHVWWLIANEASLGDWWWSKSQLTHWMPTGLKRPEPPKDA